MNDPTGARRWISNEASRAEVMRLRAGVDAIAVGVGTVKADNPQLTARGPIRPRTPPLRVVFDRGAETPLDSALVGTARDTPTVVFAHHPPIARLAALHNAGVDVFEAADLGDALSALRGFDVMHVMVEGGARVARAFLQRGLVDRLVIFQAPFALGEEGLSPFEGAADARAHLDALPVIRRAEFGEDVMTVYALNEI
jgi:diaminohydroxyphosphoribosylaminopyrimidine deaminase/5-amino-6-(5-phosphoribosylamino)uracil reductase